MIGRVAWACDDGRVPVLPVNFVMDGDAIVFRTAEGGKLSAVRQGRPLSLEADDVEPGLRTGWSVLVIGTARVVTHTVTIDRLTRLPLAPWPSAAPGTIAPTSLIRGGRTMPEETIRRPRNPGSGGARRPRRKGGHHGKTHRGRR